MTSVNRQEEVDLEVREKGRLMDVLQRNLEFEIVVDGVHDDGLAS
jgi:hypothetical protein